MVLLQQHLQVYTGSARGYEGVVVVDVTVENDVIKDVEIVEENESRPLNSFEVMPQRIVESNSTKVDTVASAAYTSKAIINATEDALSQAN